MTDIEWGTFVSIFLIGGVAGGLTAGSLAAKYGRKRTLFYNNVFFIIGGLFMSVNPDFYTLCLGRFIVGFGAGI
jgi:predicted MFS family arabinose efflux permease